MRNVLSCVTLGCLCYPRMFILVWVVSYHEILVTRCYVCISLDLCLTLKCLLSWDFCYPGISLLQQNNLAQECPYFPGVSMLLWNTRVTLGHPCYPRTPVLPRDICVTLGHPCYSDTRVTLGHPCYPGTLLLPWDIHDTQELSCTVAHVTWVSCYLGTFTVIFMDIRVTTGYRC